MLRMPKGVDVQQLTSYSIGLFATQPGSGASPLVVRTWPQAKIEQCLIFDAHSQSTSLLESHSVSVQRNWRTFRFTAIVT